MPVQRYYYSDTITDFLTRSANEIAGYLAYAYTQDINNDTTNSWRVEIETLQKSLVSYAGRGSIYFEYNIPRMGRRVDAILLIDELVFVLEFKTLDQKFSRESSNQVWDYAIDLKNFQQGSLNRVIIPILVVPNEKNSRCVLDLKPFEDNVYEPLWVNSERLHEAIELFTPNVSPEWSKDNDDRWARSGYEPTPTIIEAAVALYEEHTVEEITKHGCDIDRASEELTRIIDYSRENKRKAVCFITGVPGAGKTLIGLNTAIDQYNRNEKAIYLSGNFPLVEVLQEALARDYYRRDKIRVKQENRKPCTKEEARSKVKAFIQMIHHYRDTYLEGTEIKDGRIVPIEG